MFQAAAALELLLSELLFYFAFTTTLVVGHLGGGYASLTISLLPISFFPLSPPPPPPHPHFP